MRWRSLSALMVLGCRPSVEATPFASICGGEPGPVLLLSLADDEVLAPVVPAVRRDPDDRILAILYEGHEPARGWPPMEVRSRLLALESCGQETREVARDIEFAWVAPTGDVLGTASDETFWIDPQGGRAPIDLGGVYAGWWDDSLLILRPQGDGTFALARVWLDEQGDVTAASVAGGLQPVGSTLTDDGGEAVGVLAITTQRELVVVDIASKTTTTLAEGIDRFSDLIDGRYVVAIDATSSRAWESLLDWSTLRLTNLTPVEWNESWTVYEGGTFATSPLDAPIDETQLLLVPEYERRRLPGWWVPEGQLADGRRLWSRQSERNPTLYVIDSTLAEPRVLYEAEQAFGVEVHDGGVFLTHGLGSAPFECPTVLSIDVDHAHPPADVSPPACGQLQLPEMRFLDVDAPATLFGTGSMYLVHADGELVHLADEVLGDLRSYNYDDLEGARLVGADWLYGTRGEAPGLWRAALR